MKTWEPSIEEANRRLDRYALREALGVAALFALLIINALLWGVLMGG